MHTARRSACSRVSRTSDAPAAPGRASRESMDRFACVTPMLKERERQEAGTGRRLKGLALAIGIALLFLPAPSFSFSDFERTYNVEGSPHLQVSNVTGSIRVSSWN